MKEKVIQYWALLYWVGNMFAQYNMFSTIAAPYFNTVIIIGLLAILTSMNLLTKKGMFRSNYFIYVYTICMLLYQFSFGLFHVNDKTWTYLVSKVVSDMMFIVSVYSFPKFYGRKLFPIMAISTAVLVFIGIFMGSTDSVTGRQTFGFGNENSLSSIASVTAACFFICSEKLKAWHWGVIGILVFGLLMGGSRISLVALILGLLFKNGLKVKTFGVILLMIGSLIVIDYIGIELPGVSRLIESVESGDLSSARETERQASILMIKENPIAGNGLYAQQSEAAQLISELGSHNAYIDLVKFMGFGFGGFVILALFIQLLRFYKQFYHSPDLHIRSHLFCAFIVPVMGVYEAYIWGVNQMITTCMFMSFAYLAYIQNNTIEE